MMKKELRKDKDFPFFQYGEVVIVSERIYLFSGSDGIIGLDDSLTKKGDVLICLGLFFNKNYTDYEYRFYNLKQQKILSGPDCDTELTATLKPLK